MKTNTIQGVSLLELLIASALGSLILAGLIMIYLSIKTIYNRQQSLLDLQNSGRFALAILNERLRLAGFVGCVSGINPVDQNQAIAGYNSDNLPSFLQNQVVQGTDAVVINSCVSNSQISQNTVIVTVAYYIGDTGRSNQQGRPILALYQKPLNGDRDELVAGVEQMQILYGVAGDDGDTLTYYSAAQIKDWQKVQSVQIDLLLNSIDAILTKPESYYFHGELVTPSDLLLHRSWSTYIYLRERPLAQILSN